MNKKIIVVGHGFVGKAVDYGFSHPHIERVIVDPLYDINIEDINLAFATAIFVCVPTPMKDDGKINTDILDRVMSNIMKRVMDNTIVIVKSTVTPDIMAKYKHKQVVYNPEFLTERSANEQFIAPAFHIFGGERQATDATEKLYKDYSLCNPAPAFHMTVEEASFVKYAINSFLALKVTFFNQLYDAVGETDANFARIINAVGSDPRIGYSHTKVPGFDGKQGFGGACFPKDVSALINTTRVFTILEKCVTINNQYRNQYEKDDREVLQNINYGDLQ